LRKASTTEGRERSQTYEGANQMQRIVIAGALLHG
jgi:hypothetical protein